MPGARNVDIALARREDRVVATVTPHRLTAAARRLLGLDRDGHRSAVQAGENRGAVLEHDHVVAYQPVAAWTAAPKADVTLKRPDPAAARAPGRRTHVVVVDAQTGRPLQAATLGC